MRLPDYVKDWLCEYYTVPDAKNPPQPSIPYKEWIKRGLGEKITNFEYSFLKTCLDPNRTVLAHEVLGPIFLELKDEDVICELADHMKRYIKRSMSTSDYLELFQQYSVAAMARDMAEIMYTDMIEAYREGLDVQPPSDSGPEEAI